MIRTATMPENHFRKWLPAILWATLILAVSGSGGSSSRSAAWLDRLLGELSFESLFYINYSLRKAAHVLSYGILGWLNLRATGYRRPVLAVMLATVVALINELLQGISPERTASLADVGLDVCGAALLVAAAWGLRGARTRLAE